MSQHLSPDLLALVDELKADIEQAARGHLTQALDTVCYELTEDDELMAQVGIEAGSAAAFSVLAAKGWLRPPS